VRGTRVELELDEEQFVGGGAYLFQQRARAISRALHLYEQFYSACCDNPAEKGRFERMATEGRPVNPHIVAPEIESRLREKPFTFEFFQAMRLLERLLPDRLPVGGFGPPSAEVARMGAHPSLGFPASEIQSLQWDEGQAPFLSVNFMG